MPHSFRQWAEEIERIARRGLEETTSPFDEERFQAALDIAGEMTAHGGELVSPPAPDGPLNPWPATPKVDVRGVVFEKERLLLVRERADGGWTLPGGWADVGLSPAENVVREIREEAGYETQVVRLLAAYDRRRHPHVPANPFHIYKFFFLCRIVGGQATTSIETDDVRFFGRHEIPPLSLGRVTPQQIETMFEFHHHPDRPAVFD